MQTITGDLLQDSLLHLLYCALKEEKPALPTDLNWEALLQLANRQQVYNTVLPVLEKAAVLPPEKTTLTGGMSGVELLGYFLPSLALMLGDQNMLQRFASELAPLFEQKLIAYDASTQRLRLTERGMEVGNQIFEVFVIT